ncbi:MAG: hypothetical protein KDB52_00690 [Solirubrobacterales bacterium]|nr:hypothetical protein [Solirubrobacterales bacterium]
MLGSGPAGLVWPFARRDTSIRVQQFGVSAIAEIPEGYPGGAVGAECGWQDEGEGSGEFGSESFRVKLDPAPSFNHAGHIEILVCWFVAAP